MSKQVFRDVQYITVNEAHAGQRVDNFLISLLKNIPKSRVYRMVRKGEVRVNRRRVDASYRLLDGDSVRVPPVREEETAPLPSPSRSLRQCLSRSVLFEDEYLMVINKPPGIPVHGGTKTLLGVVEAMRALYPHYPQLELVHRLDLGTSGCLVLAKKRSILRELHGMLREGQMRKIYLALTLGCWKNKECRVNVPLEKNHLVSGERIVKAKAEGKAALTVFRSVSVYQGATLVEAELHTGRTHQIRVHARHQGHPVAGDEKYGDATFNEKMRKTGLKRMFLHAFQISFTLASNGRHYAVTAPMDDELQNCLTRMR